MRFLILLALLPPMLSVAQVDFKMTVNGFRQDDLGNCASIAIVKAAIIHYGVGNVFKVETSQNSSRFILRDGTELVINQQEIETASNSLLEYIKGDSEIAKYARLCFIIMVKNYEEANPKKPGNPLINLNKKTYNEIAYKYLGLESSSIEYLYSKNLKNGTKNVNALSNEELYILYNGRYTAVASRDLYDEFGSLAPIKRFHSNHWHLFIRGRTYWAYRFKK